MNRTVFLAFFLVLVFWPVYSHGRAYETESVVFNNTHLPYKGTIDAVPATRVVLHTYDHFFLILIWRNILCESHSYPCGHQVLPLIVLHGMWPQLSGHIPIDCSGAGRERTYDLNSLRQYHNGELVNHLNSFWLNLGRGPHPDLWKREYVKHGSCFFRTQVEYFESTVVMMRQIAYLPQKLEQAGYKPQHSYPFGSLLQAIQRFSGYLPKLQCRTFPNESIPSLNQIFFCATISNYLVDCPYLSVPVNEHCGSGDVYLR